jgi:hypothetical protein
MHVLAVVQSLFVAHAVIEPAAALVVLGSRTMLVAVALGAEVTVSSAVSEECPSGVDLAVDVVISRCRDVDADAVVRIRVRSVVGVVDVRFRVEVVSM